jgi:antitoxin FitA
MAAVIIRNLSPETHRALKARARGMGRSTEAEMRLILEAAVQPSRNLKLGSLLAALGRKHGPLSPARDPAPTAAADFS